MKIEEVKTPNWKFFVYEREGMWWAALYHKHGKLYCHADGNQRKDELIEQLQLFVPRFGLLSPNAILWPCFYSQHDTLANVINPNSHDYLDLFNIGWQYYSDGSWDFHTPIRITQKQIDYIADWKEEPGFEREFPTWWVNAEKLKL